MPASRAGVSGVFMADPVDLLQELKALRRGQGVQAPAITGKLGPVLRQLCDIQISDGAGLARTKVIRWLSGLIADLPDTLQLVASTALGMNPDAQHEFYNDRLMWLAEQANRDSRTVQRKVDGALTRICEAAVMPQPQPFVPTEDEWHVDRLDALLRLDGDTPVCQETRVIVADKDGIDQITWSMSLPGTAGDERAGLEVQVLHGVVRLREHWPSARRYHLDLQLPQPLPRGQSHRFALEVRIPVGQPMLPSYIFFPERRCAQFNLVVRFAQGVFPQQVWRVSESFHRDADDIRPSTNVVAVDSIGEVHASFTDLKPLHGYGIQWKFEGDPIVDPAIVDTAQAPSSQAR